MVLAPTAVAHAAVLILTSLHHWYGAVRFDTPWRAHVIHLAVWIGVALGVFLSIGWLARDRPLGRWAVLAVVALSVLAAVAWLGLYKGGYNHVLKNALCAARVSDQTFRRLFPPAIYEPPGDWVFELGHRAAAAWASCRLERHEALAHGRRDTNLERSSRCTPAFGRTRRSNRRDETHVDFGGAL